MHSKIFETMFIDLLSKIHNNHDSLKVVYEIRNIDDLTYIVSYRRVRYSMCFCIIDKSTNAEIAYMSVNLERNKTTDGKVIGREHIQPTLNNALLMFNMGHIV